MSSSEMKHYKNSNIIQNSQVCMLYLDGMSDGSTTSKLEKGYTRSIHHHRMLITRHIIYNVFTIKLNCRARSIWFLCISGVI